MLDPDSKDETEAERETRENVLWAEAFILGSPDYHGSMSGAMKNFLDYFWREFTGKTFGYIVASHEKGLTVQDQMRTAVRQCYGWSLPYGIGFNGDAEFDKDGQPNEKLRDRVEMMARDLVIYGGLIYSQFRKDIDATVREPGLARSFQL
jgi:FMN reductase